MSTFAIISKEEKVKTLNGQVVKVKADRDLLGRLLIAAKGRDVNLKEVLQYE